MLVKIEKPGPTVTEEVEVCFPLYCRYYSSSEYGDYDSESWIRIDEDKSIITITKIVERGNVKWEVEVDSINFFRELDTYLETWEYPASSETDFNEALASLSKVLTVIARQCSRESSAGAADSQVFNRR